MAHDHPHLWADDGSMGKGFIHPPKIPYFVVSTWTERMDISMRNAPSQLPYILAIYDSETGVLDGKASGQTMGGIAYTSPLAPILDGRTFPDSNTLFDALHGLGYHVVTTKTGGTYWLARGKMPEKKRRTNADNQKT